ncbi:4398_t:CDS:2 [Cetraspora pellucida]|uniref:4398_t:CDS:1 n=1 Tax=Cetraspora pellucida TaxID=1433469 RepID=A0ACA9N3Y3_9GLOM|nr:4398_t:CDS:2 [Cetraspora pellucida]
MATELKKVKLTSSEGTEFIIDRKVAEKSVLLKNMLEDVGESDMAIPLPNVTGPILNKVIDYCTHHQDDPFVSQEDDSKKVSDDIDDWDAEFCKGKTPDEIRKTFNIINDFTPEEEEHVRKENEWCEER